MKGKRFSWLRKRGGFIIRELVVLVCALTLGLGYSVWRSDTYMPSMEGNIHPMLILEDSLLMASYSGGKNNLIRISYDGTLLNYTDTDKGRAFQALAANGDTVYAVQSDRAGGQNRQRLLALSLQDAAMRPDTLTELSQLAGAPIGVVWRDICLSLEDGETSRITLSGLDEQGQGYLARWNLAEGQGGFEKILPGERLWALKYVQEGRYVWINQNKEVGQYIDGVWQRDILAEQSNTPLHISTCGTRCFVSDSVSGDIFEILPDGEAVLFRAGGLQAGTSGCEYRQMECYATYLDNNGEVRVAGLCAGTDSAIIAGEEWTVRTLQTGSQRLELLLRHSWPACAVFWAALAALVEAVWGICGSTRLAVRLLLCEIVIAAGLLGTVTAIQYRSFQETIREEAYQKLRLIGGSLSQELALHEQSASVDNAVNHLEQQVGMAVAERKEEYGVCVIRDTAYGLAIASDSAAPEGYLIEDVKPREYVSVAIRALQTGQSILERIQTSEGYAYLYVEPFSQGGFMGCTVISQGEEDMLAGQAQFFQRLLPVLIACPFLFLILVWMTRRLLRPLDEIRRALEEFYTEGGGNRMELSGMPRTELYEVGRVFNQLSVETKTQFNELQTINDSYLRLAPECLLQMLRKRSVTQLEAGDHVPVDGARLILIPQEFPSDWESLDRIAKQASQPAGDAGGMFVGYDEELGALSALFPSAEQAHTCAQDCLDRMEQDGLAVMAAVWSETVEFGVSGGEALLYPLAVSGQARRRREILRRVAGFGAVLVQNSCEEDQKLRLLGWDGALMVYEDPACRPSGWQSCWRDAVHLWEDALLLFREGQFPPAMRLFAKVLRLMPEDMAARWYLLRCDVLRSVPSQTPDTGLLFDWKEPDHE